jgi:L-2-hydroxycarboxylate dehydrogenase (NAD+)
MASFHVDTLADAAVAKLMEVEVRESHARIVVDHMLTADVWGRPTHGLSVRFPLVFRQAREGVGKQPMEIQSDRGTSILVEGHNSFGYLVGRQCTDLLVERAVEHGHCVIAVKRLRHTGMLGYYADLGAQSGLVTLVFSHCMRLMAPYGGTRALLGTNPMAVGFPAKPHPILVDLGTAATGGGQIKVLEQQGGNLPPGHALDADGHPTQDPAAAKGGCLLPFGGHRGGALAVAIQLLAGAFTGADTFPPPAQNYGLLLMGFQKGLFAGDDGYDRSVKGFMAEYLGVPSQAGCEVRLPGASRYQKRDDPGSLMIAVSDEVARLLDLRE